MLVEVQNVNLTNAWEEQFTDRQTGEVVKFHRALLSSVGEPPCQLSVSRDDFEGVQACIGAMGTATLDIDARPGSRVRVYLKGIE